MHKPNEHERLLELLQRARHPEGVPAPEIREEVLRRLVRSIMPQARASAALRQRVWFLARIGRAWPHWLFRRLVSRARRRTNARGILEGNLSEGELTEQERQTLGLLFAVDLREVPEEALLHQEACPVMLRLLGRLPEAQREALLLEVAYDLSPREISQLIGCSEEAADRLVERARAAIFRHGLGYFEE